MKIRITIPVTIDIEVGGDLAVETSRMLVQGVGDNFHEAVRLMDREITQDLRSEEFSGGHSLSVDCVGTGSPSFRVGT